MKMETNKPFNQVAPEFKLVPKGATHFLDNNLPTTDPWFCKYEEDDGEWKCWSKHKPFWARVKADKDFFMALQELPKTKMAKELDQAIDSALNTQVGGGHYKDYAIQPVEFIHKNKIGFCEGNAIKYLCRWREKGGLEDLKKARHYIDLLIEMEQPATGVTQ